MINPAWTQHNDLYNEGGEGYNPHPKFIDAAPAVAAPAKPAGYGNRLVRDERGNTVRAAKLAERMQADELRLTRITDPAAREITERAIAFARQALA